LVSLDRSAAQASRYLRVRHLQGEAPFERADLASQQKPSWRRDVLVLAGISAHFLPRPARYTWIGGAVILVFAVLQLLELPAPPV
jgi:hypothetical protein